MTSFRQIAVQGVLGFVGAVAAVWWLSEEELESPEPEEAGEVVRHEKTERSVVVGVSSTTSMVKVDRTGAGEESRLMSVGEKLQALGEGARAVPAPVARPDEDAGAPAFAPPTEVADRRPENRRIESRRGELPFTWKTPVARTGFEEDRARRLAKNDAPAFVPHEPAELPAERTKWQPALKGLGVNTWSYRVVRISKHAYRVNAYFVFADGRSFMYSTTTLNGYPAAPTLVRDWLAGNPSEEV